MDFDAEVELVGVSFMTALAPRAYEIAREFRGRGRRTIAGGYHPTLMPDEAAAHFDSVVVGDAEELWPLAVQDMQTKGTMRREYRHSQLVDLAAIPPARRELERKNRRHYAFSSAVQTARGCVHGCKYCSVSAFHGQSYRTRPLEDVLSELRGIGRDIVFVDDNIIADPCRAKSLFRALIPMRRRWVSQSSLLIADDNELLDLAAKSGCQGLFIGVETLSAENLDGVGKSFNDSKGYVERIGRIRGKGDWRHRGHHRRMDSDGPGVFERTLEFLEAARVDAIQLNIMTPLPGTRLYEEFDKDGRITDKDWSKYDFRHVVIKPARMSTVELQAGADWMYAEFYGIGKIVRRFARSVFDLGLFQAICALGLCLTYRYDNIREGIVGWNPARSKSERRIGMGYSSRLWFVRRIVRSGLGRLAAAAVIAGIVVAIGGCAMLGMPGKTHAGPLPEMTAAEKELSSDLKAHVVRLADRIGPRNLTCPERLDEAADYIEEEFRSAGYEPKRISYNASRSILATFRGAPIDDKILYHNIVAELKGTTRPREIVVVGAHYDSPPIDRCRAANDNASGVAATIALSRMLRTRSPERTIRFVAFTNEEPPYFWTRGMGSHQYASACKKNKENVVGMLSLETIGYYSDEKASQEYPFPANWFYPSTGNFIAFVGNISSRSLTPRLRQILPSEHRLSVRGRGSARMVSGRWLVRPVAVLADGVSGVDGDGHGSVQVPSLSHGQRRLGQAGLRQDGPRRGRAGGGH